MPIKLRLVDNGIGVVLKAVAPVSGDQIVDAIERFLREEADAFPALRYWYSDYLASGVLDADIDHTWRVAATSIKASRGNRDLVVALCAPTSSAFVLLEVWKTLAEETGWEIQVFRVESDAKAWLRAKVQDDLAFT